MKTLCLSLLFTVAVGATRVAALTAVATPTPSPTPAAAPLPATEPEPGANKDKDKDKDKADKMDGCCPMCQAQAAGKDKAAAPGEDKPSADEAAVLKLERDWCEAEARHDAAFLDKVETDGFVFTDSLGKVSTKAEELAEAKQGGERIDFKLSDMKAHVYGDTVVLTGQTAFVPPQGSNLNFSYRWTDIFVRQPGGEWKVAASQATALNQEKAESSKDDDE